MKYKWTVLFLVHAANKQTRDHVKTLVEILKNTAYNKEIKVLILYSALQHSIEKGVCMQVTLNEFVPKALNDKQSLKEIQSYGILDIGDDKKLCKIFQAVREKYASERFLLFTWDHGSGFGIFKTNPKERGLLEIDTSLNFEENMLKSQQEKSVFYLDMQIDFEVVSTQILKEDVISREPNNIAGKKNKVKTSMLTNDEIRNIIMSNPVAKRVDLMIMMNCAMQMIETGYALNNSVEYLIAPETCIFWAGYDYKAIIDLLCSQPAIDTERVGRFALDTMEQYYEKTASKQYFDDLVVSMVKPAAALDVKLAVDEIAVSLIRKLATSFQAIKEARSICEDLTQKYVTGIPYHYLDLLNCIFSLTKILEGEYFLKLKNAMSQYVAHIIKGANYDVIDITNYIAKVNGCTIYYPSSAEEADKDPYYDWFYKASNYQTLFAANSKWKNFLEDYFKQDRNHKKKGIL